MGEALRQRPPAPLIGCNALPAPGEPSSCPCVPLGIPLASSSTSSPSTNFTSIRHRSKPGGIRAWAGLIACWRGCRGEVAADTGAAGSASRVAAPRGRRRRQTTRHARVGRINETFYGRARPVGQYLKVEAAAGMTLISFPETADPAHLRRRWCRWTTPPASPIAPAQPPQSGSAVPPPRPSTDAAAAPAFRAPRAPRNRPAPARSRAVRT